MIGLMLFYMPFKSLSLTPPATGWPFPSARAHAHTPQQLPRLARRFLPDVIDRYREARVPERVGRVLDGQVSPQKPHEFLLQPSSSINQACPDGVAQLRLVGIDGVVPSLSERAWRMSVGQT